MKQPTTIYISDKAILPDTTHGNSLAAEYYTETQLPSFEKPTSDHFENILIKAFLWCLCPSSGFQCREFALLGLYGEYWVLSVPVLPF